MAFKKSDVYSALWNSCDELRGVIVALTGQIFYSKQIPVRLRFLPKDKKEHTIQHGEGQIPSHLRDRHAPLLDAMTRTMPPLITRLLANAKQSRTLATLRDPDKSGLPKLLSGEIVPSSS